MPTIQAKCPNCKKSYDAPESVAGKMAKCMTCSKPFRVPPLVPDEPPPIPEEDFFQGAMVVSRYEEPAPPKPTPQPLPEPPKPSGGIGPVFIEILLTFLTGGLLGGCGSIAAGKGPARVFVSVGVAAFCFLLLLGSGGLMIFLVAPFWFLFVLIKLVVDLFACAS